MRYLGEAAFWLTLLAVGLAFYLAAGRGVGPGRLLGESWPLMVLVAALLTASMGLGWLFVRLARGPARGGEDRPAGEGDERPNP
ncbi:hypothetical protein [Limnochorda pilosa]|uniref:Uncharacterized protein n=1 Tax=Limnochorda pilosa TaxID=1555112 RepID=A0A0K2SG74_LIMPI|nr:hypothetical protein [Limnochorda pilosa]BAS26042.1 hypothetical protein LIP_0185 [Limnochorda pilosa]